MPLLDSVSAESRRYVAAALSECAAAPNGLVRRLCEEPVEVAAPLLIRSAALTDIDLIALIGRHGMPHARAIARRPGLNKTIGDLIRALEGPRLVVSGGNAVEATQPAHAADAEPAAPLQSAETARQRLRAMMLPDAARHETRSIVRGLSAYARLRDTALSGNPAFFQTSLADALCIDFQSARQIAESRDITQLGTALRALDLGPEKAFVIAAAAHPEWFSNASAIRDFLENYRETPGQAALDWLDDRKAVAAPASENSGGSAAASQPANQDGPATKRSGKLRARS